MDEAELDELDLQQHIDAAMSKLGLDCGGNYMFGKLDGAAAAVTNEERTGEAVSNLEEAYKKSTMQRKLARKREQFDDDLLSLDDDMDHAKVEDIFDTCGLQDDDLVRAIAKLEARYSRIIAMLQHEIGQCRNSVGVDKKKRQ